MPPWYQNRFLTRTVLDSDWLWPRSRFIDVTAWIESTSFEPWSDLPSAHSAYMLNGVTRDSFGARLANCLVRAYRTSDDIVVGEVMSDAGGNYSISLFTTDPCYLVAYKNGAPDVAGTTANTLIPV